MDERWTFQPLFLDEDDGSKIATVKLGFCENYDHYDLWGVPWRNINYTNYNLETIRTIIFPDYLINPDNGERYTVIGIRWGFPVGWKVELNAMSRDGYERCDISFKVYIPANIRWMEAGLFKRPVYNTDHNLEATGGFEFYFEDEEKYQVFNESWKRGWKTVGNHYIPTDENYPMDWFEESNKEKENKLYYILGINKWDRSNETGISNTIISNVNYRTDNGVIYFDEAVKDIKLYDLSGRLLYFNKNAGTLNIGNNLKGAYLLKYDNKTIKLIF
jgi:hypothetical protein